MLPFFVPALSALASCFGYRALYWLYGFDFTEEVMHLAILAGASIGAISAIFHHESKNLR